MPRYGQLQDKRFEDMDGPAQVFEPGGTNGKASIKGLPVRPEVHANGLRREGQATGVMAEPVAVLLRDAVTIDTAVRLTGAERQTLQVAAAKGYLPSLKLGGATSPYLVRIRDVISYLARMSAFKMTRRGFKPGEDFLGFPEWLVERVRAAYPDGVSAAGTPYASEVVVPDRGGRPRIKPPEEESGSAKKTGARRSNHAPRRKRPVAQKLLKPGDFPPPGFDRTTLPKWHPLWVRPGTPEAAAPKRSRARRDPG
jgi:hypothetical protein